MSYGNNGRRKYKWCIDSSGRRYMVKGNYGESYQQSLNEIFATNLHAQQNCSFYTTYSLTKLQLEDGQEGLGCLCYDFCNESSGNSMFYNVPYEHLSKTKLKDIKTHSFIAKEMMLLKYVKDRNAVDLDKCEMDFSVYERDIIERHMRIPLLKELYQRKLDLLRAFQQGKDIWKSDF